MLRLFRYFIACFRALRDLPFCLNKTDPALVHLLLERLRGNPRYQNGKCLTLSGQKVYSQCDEDGMIREIFRRIGETNKTFVEFGVGDGLENNTLALLFEGWVDWWHMLSGFQELF